MYDDSYIDVHPEVNIATISITSFFIILNQLSLPDTCGRAKRYPYCVSDSPQDFHARKGSRSNP